MTIEKQAAVLCYDYRDFGASSSGPIHRSKVDMGTWGVKDQAAALDYMCDRYPDFPIEVIGHSLGGMFLAFHANARKVRKLTAVASGPPYWRHHPLAFIPAVLAFWFGVGPVVTAAEGYTPGRVMGLGADLPKNVYWQWRRWCTSKAFYRPDWGKALPIPDLDSVECDVHLVAIADDAMIPPRVAHDLARFYPSARVTRSVIAPADIGMKQIGHLRVFSHRCRAAWPTLAS